MARTPSADLEKAIRQLVKAPTRPERGRVYYNGGKNSNGRTKNTEGEDIPTLEFSASVGVEVTSLPARGYRLTLEGSDEDPDVMQKEQFRETRVERIYGQDGESYVDVEAIDSIGFKNRELLTRKFNLKPESRAT